MSNAGWHKNVGLTRYKTEKVGVGWPLGVAGEVDLFEKNPSISHLKNKLEVWKPGLLLSVCFCLKNIINSLNDGVFLAEIIISALWNYPEVHINCRKICPANFTSNYWHIIGK